MSEAIHFPTFGERLHRAHDLARHGASRRDIVQATNLRADQVGEIFEMVGRLGHGAPLVLSEAEARAAEAAVLVENREKDAA